MPQWMMLDGNRNMVALLSASSESELAKLPAGHSYEPFVEGNLRPVAAGDSDPMVRVRLKRNALLAASAWTTSPASPLSARNQAAWLAYQKQLHRVTKNLTDAAAVVWPAAPEIEYAD